MSTSLHRPFCGVITDVQMNFESRVGEGIQRSSKQHNKQDNLLLAIPQWSFMNQMTV